MCVKRRYNEENLEAGGQGRGIENKKHGLSYKKKRHENPSRFYVECRVQVIAPSKVVEIARVQDILKQPYTDYAYVIHLYEQPKIFLYLSEL